MDEKKNGQGYVDEERGAAKLAWDIFEKTGSISYYMLYKELTKRR